MGFRGSFRAKPFHDSMMLLRHSWFLGQLLLHLQGALITATLPRGAAGFARARLPGIPSFPPWMGKKHPIYLENSALTLPAGPVPSSLSITQETKVLLSQLFSVPLQRSLPWQLYPADFGDKSPITILPESCRAGQEQLPAWVRDRRPE